MAPEKGGIHPNDRRAIAGPLRFGEQSSWANAKVTGTGGDCLRVQIFNLEDVV